MNQIYYVNVLDIPKENRQERPNPTPKDWVSRYYKTARCWGWFKDKEEAIQCIKENWTDIYEDGYYNLALIESMGEGICNVMRDEYLFFDVEFDRDKDSYTITEIERPKVLNNLVGFSYS